MLASAFVTSLLKFIHIWAVIMSVGNAVLAPYRRRRARLTGNAQVIAGTYEIHTRSGRAITIPWFAITVLSGLALAWYSGIPILSTGWIVWAIALTLVVAALFVACITPLQRQATVQAVAFANQGAHEQREAFEQVTRRLEPLSHFAHVLFIAIIALMIFKPALHLPW